MARAQKMIFNGWIVKMLAMPSARHRIMDKTPSLRNKHSMLATIALSP